MKSGIKRKRNTPARELFGELAEGITALAEARAGMRTLWTYPVDSNPKKVPLASLRGIRADANRGHCCNAMNQGTGGLASAVVCEAIHGRLLLEFDYGGFHRVVQPYCHGRTTAGQETLRAIQVGGQSRSAMIASGKLWTLAKMANVKVSEKTFTPDDPRYNPQDSAFESIHCRI